MSRPRHQSSKNYQLSLLYRDIHRIFTNDEKNKNEIIKNLKTNCPLFSNKEVANSLDELLILGENHVELLHYILSIIDTKFANYIAGYYEKSIALSYLEELQYLIDEIAVMRDKLSSSETEDFSISKNPTKTPIIPEYRSYQPQPHQQVEKYFGAWQVFGVIVGFFIGAAITYFLGPEMGVNAGTQTFELCLLLGAGIGSLCGWGAGKKMMNPVSNLAPLNPSGLAAENEQVAERRIATFQHSPSRNLHREEFQARQKSTTKSHQTAPLAQRSMLTVQLQAQQSNSGAGVNRPTAGRVYR